MADAADLAEIVLGPGDLHFSGAAVRLRTLVGSCVAVALWHPQLRLGGMCHYMLPGRGSLGGASALDGRYADEAFALLVRELRRSGTVPAQYEVSVCGGGDQFPNGPKGGGPDVPARNVTVALDLLRRHGFSTTRSDVGGQGHREISLDLWDGRVSLRHVDQTIDVLVAR